MPERFTPLRWRKLPIGIGRRPLKCDLWMAYATNVYIKALRDYGKTGPKTFQSLLYHFGSPEAIINADWHQIAKLPRIGEKRAREIAGARDFLDRVVLEIEALDKNNIRLLSLFDEAYPRSLKAIDDPPVLLYLQGQFPVVSEHYLAVIGTKNATNEGLAAAVELGKILAQQGVVVVSGLAKGIDAASHIGALKEQGKCYGVLGCGLAQIYPKENEALAKAVSQNGALLTEYAPEVPVNVGHLMARNRIVAGLSQAVIAVDPDQTNNGGTMDAIQRAQQQGKPVYIFDPEKRLTLEMQHQLKVQTLYDPGEIVSLLPYFI